ncbi:PPOX class F420-dependent oxidoreductase [Nocardia sp. CNY236]|uniref:PPOX class F420-dependent oxidoreductase n=1 Tax=Nocardia sp. CNY236 TaxID=1169152 RepID=UPI000404D454|nr:PPOX class F420-dependent oxidoreductase [Nocardia sp. CNY236]
MASLSDPDVRAFLTRGTRTGKLAVVAADGRPMVTPVWFVLDGDELVFTTGISSVKAKAFARDGRVAVCVDLEEPPYGEVQLQGSVTLSKNPDELLRVATEVGGRYMGHDRAVEFGTRNGGPGMIVVRLRPSKVIANFDVTA